MKQKTQQWVGEEACADMIVLENRKVSCWPYFVVCLRYNQTQIVSVLINYM